MTEQISSVLALVALATAVLTLVAYSLVALRIWTGRDARRKDVPFLHFTPISIAASVLGVLIGTLITGSVTDIGVSDLETLWVPILSGAAAMTLLELNAAVKDGRSAWPRAAVAVFSFLVGLALAAHGGLGL
ncbi:hypothetical protein [Streptomyces sp. NPDC058751]|uniref:hypothetical protein n=1 Tax=Streptomyces sp. NPDC058751 TaxID=3346623 RepID=UPI00368112AF